MDEWRRPSNNCAIARAAKQPLRGGAIRIWDDVVAPSPTEVQGHLVKGLRLRGLSTMDEANRFLPECISDNDRRFALEPHSHYDAHHPPSRG